MRRFRDVWIWFISVAVVLSFIVFLVNKLFFPHLIGIFDLDISTRIISLISTQLSVGVVVSLILLIVAGFFIDRVISGYYFSTD